MSVWINWIDMVRFWLWFNLQQNNNNFSVLDAETKEAPTFTFDARLAYRTATNGTTWEKLAEARENRSLVCHFTKSQVNILLKNIANKLFFPVFISCHRNNSQS